MLLGRYSSFPILISAALFAGCGYEEAESTFADDRLGQVEQGLIIPPGDFQVVVLPDTQYYTLNYLGNPLSDTYRRQTEWIRDNQTRLTNLAFVSHMGDVSQDATDSQFAVADGAHDVLDAAGIRYSIMPGNHDHPNSGRGARDTTNFNEKFGPSRFTALGYGSNYVNLGAQNDNSGVSFNAGGQDYMVVSLDFMPGKDVLCWANQVVANNPGKKVIVVTHAYLDRQSSTQTSEIRLTTEELADEYELIGSGGETIWDEFVGRHNNIFMVLAGHVTGTNYYARPQTGGGLVHEILTDYQKEGGDNGNGWLRILDFDLGAGAGGQGEVRVAIESVTGKTELCKNLDIACPYSTDPNLTPPPGTPPGSTYHTFSFDADLRPWTSANYVPAPAHSTQKVFSDRVVNPIATGDQGHPGVTTAANGNSVVVWHDDQNNNGSYDIWVRGFDPFGCERFAARQVNTVASGNQQLPVIAGDSAGNFVVVWEDDSNGNGKYNIMMRGYTATGGNRFGPIVVNADTDGQQRDPDVSMDDQGRFVVVWEDDNDGNGKYEIFAKGYRVTPTNQLLVAFSDITVNSVNDGNQLAARIDMDPVGNFVIVWEDDSQSSLPYYEIFARGYKFNTSHQLQNLFSDIRVNANASGRQLAPDVAVGGSQDFVVTWEDDYDLNGKYQIRAKGYRLNGTSAPILRFSEIVVNSDSSGQQIDPSIDMDSTGSFVVSWEDDHDGNGKYNAWVRGFYSTGAQRFADLRANKGTPGQQRNSEVALAPGGRVVVSWADDINGNGKGEIVLRGIEMQ